MADFNKMSKIRNQLTAISDNFQSQRNKAKKLIIKLEKNKINKFQSIKTILDLKPIKSQKNRIIN